MEGDGFVEGSRKVHSKNECQSIQKVKWLIRLRIFLFTGLRDSYHYVPLMREAPQGAELSDGNTSMN